VGTYKPKLSPAGIGYQTKGILAERVVARTEAFHHVFKKVHTDGVGQNNA
jgi:hypothetical protein